MVYLPPWKINPPETYYESQIGIIIPTLGEVINMFHSTKQIFIPVISLTTSGLMWVANEPNSNTSLLRRPFRFGQRSVGGMIWHSGLVDNIPYGSSRTFYSEVGLGYHLEGWPYHLRQWPWINKSIKKYGRCYSSDKYMPSIKYHIKSSQGLDQKHTPHLSPSRSMRSSKPQPPSSKPG